jgi:hypothetical protein
LVVRHALECLACALHFLIELGKKRLADRHVCLRAAK